MVRVTHLFLSGKVSFFLFGGVCLGGWKLKNKFEPVTAKGPKLDFEKSLSENFVNACAPASAQPSSPPPLVVQPQSAP